MSCEALCVKVQRGLALMSGAQPHSTVLNLIVLCLSSQLPPLVTIDDTMMQQTSEKDKHEHVKCVFFLLSL